MAARIWQVRRKVTNFTHISLRTFDILDSALLCPTLHNRDYETIHTYDTPPPPPPYLRHSSISFTIPLNGRHVQYATALALRYFQHKHHITLTQDIGFGVYLFILRSMVVAPFRSVPLLFYLTYIPCQVFCIFHPFSSPYRLYYLNTID
jgi:hypothetical protein